MTSRLIIEKAEGSYSSVDTDFMDAHGTSEMLEIFLGHYRNFAD